MNTDKVSSLAAALLAWYDEVRRDLPFRRTRDPYAIWVSEVMLQQTQVTTVVPYFERWMQRFPDVSALSRASEDEVLHAWQGLGYYSRARSLRLAAQAVVERFAGVLPRAVDDLQSLPGIGPYSAGAIASIAYGQRAPVVDGNVVRVLSRLFELRGDPAKAANKRQLWQRAADLVPSSRPGDFNQALMELGATVCTPQKPRCALCPLAKPCRARALGVQEDLPELPGRAAVTEVAMAAALLMARGRVLVVQLCADAPRWANMWQFPNVELERAESAASGARRALRELVSIEASADRALGEVKHSVTRYRITLSAWLCRAEHTALGELSRVERAVWKRPAELEQLAMPAAHRRLAQKLERTLSQQQKKSPA
ncbi:MAG: A/G-specific adenine glycosylase [Polyangiaceae bacterium]